MQLSPANIPVFVLAGGRSRRFGQDKARAVLIDRPLLIHAVHPYLDLGMQVCVVADAPNKYKDLGLRTIADRQTGLGPMGGLLRALEAAQDPWLLLAACDLLGLKTAWIEQLLAAPAQGRRAVAFHAGRWEPLPALFHRDVLAELRRAVFRGELALWRLLERLPALAVPRPSDWGEATQINTQEDLGLYARRLRQPRGRTGQRL